MPLINQRADSLRLYLSGASSDAGTQADPALSLGNFRSTTRCGSLGYILTSPIAGARVDFVSGANGTGTGTLYAPTVNTLAWTAPGGTQGEAVTIANGETRVIEDADAGKFIIVTRTSADDLTGTSSARLVNIYNDVFGQTNAAAGTGNAYRCVVLKAGATINHLRVWIDASVSNVAIALEQPSSQPSGSFTTIANATTSPGLIFVSPTSASHADALAVQVLAPNEQVAVWIRRDLTAIDAGPRYEVPIRWSYEYAE